MFVLAAPGELIAIQRRAASTTPLARFRTSTELPSESAMIVQPAFLFPSRRWPWPAAIALRPIATALWGRSAPAPCSPRACWNVNTLQKQECRYKQTR